MNHAKNGDGIRSGEVGKNPGQSWNHQFARVCYAAGTPDARVVNQVPGNVFDTVENLNSNPWIVLEDMVENRVKI